MGDQDFIEWLIDHGHSITIENKHYESVTQGFQKKPFNPELAFRLALDSYLSENPPENFFSNGGYIYSPRFDDDSQQATPTTKGTAKKCQDNLYTAEEIYDLYCLALPKQLGLPFEFEKRVSKQRDNLLELLKARPDYLDLDRIITEILTRIKNQNGRK